MPRRFLFSISLLTLLAQGGLVMAGTGDKTSMEERADAVQEGPPAQRSRLVAPGEDAAAASVENSLYEGLQHEIEVRTVREAIDKISDPKERQQVIAGAARLIGKTKGLSFWGRSEIITVLAKVANKEQGHLPNFLDNAEKLLVAEGDKVSVSALADSVGVQQRDLVTEIVCPYLSKIHLTWQGELITAVAGLKAEGAKETVALAATLFQGELDGNHWIKCLQALDKVGAHARADFASRAPALLRNSDGFQLSAINLEKLIKVFAEVSDEERGDIFSFAHDLFPFCCERERDDLLGVVVREVKANERKDFVQLLLPILQQGDEEGEEVDDDREGSYNALEIATDLASIPACDRAPHIEKADHFLRQARGVRQCDRVNFAKTLDGIPSEDRQRFIGLLDAWIKPEMEALSRLRILDSLKNSWVKDGQTKETFIQLAQSAMALQLNENAKATLVSKIEGFEDPNKQAVFMAHLGELVDHHTPDWIAEDLICALSTYCQENDVEGLGTHIRDVLDRAWADKITHALDMSKYYRWLEALIKGPHLQLDDRISGYTRLDYLKGWGTPG